MEHRRGWDGDRFDVLTERTTGGESKKRRVLGEVAAGVLLLFVVFGASLQ